MNIANALIAKNILGGIAAVVIAGLTVFTTGAGVIKVAGSIQRPPTSVPEVNAAMDERVSGTVAVKTVARSNQISPTPTPSPTQVNAGLKVGTALTTTPTPTTTMSPKTSQATNVQTSTGCIITLFGKQYDVVTLQTTHSGGNVFKCGTDMTTTYQAQHGTDLTRMQPYLVTNTTTGSTGTTGGSIGSTGTTGSAGSTTTVSSQSSDDEHEPEDSEESEESEENDDHDEVRQVLERAVRESDD